MVLDVDDEHRRAILHERGGGDVLDFAEARVERLHDEFALAEKLVHDERVGAALIAHDDHAQLVTGGFLLAALEHLVRGDEADLSAVEVEMLPPLEQLDLVFRELQRADDVGEGERIRLAADVDEQRAHHRKRERQLQEEARALAGHRRHAHGAAHLLHHVLHDVEADAAAGNVRDRLLHREAGQEQKFQQLRLAQFLCGLGVGQAACDDFLAQPLEIDAVAVVGHDNLQRARAVPGLEVHDALVGFARGAAALG